MATVLARASATALQSRINAPEPMAAQHSPICRAQHGPSRAHSRLQSDFIPAQPLRAVLGDSRPIVPPQLPLRHSRWKKDRCSPPPCSSAGATPQVVLSLLPRPLTYSTRMADANAGQIAELWKATLGVERNPAQVRVALRHSFSMVVVIDEAFRHRNGDIGKVVGVGRAVSDGAFVATICDVAVIPEYQRRGIGRRIVRELVKDMRRKGPSGFAVFPPPSARRFFWHLGFRADRKYRLMAYQGAFLDVPAGDIVSYQPALSIGLAEKLREIYTKEKVAEQDKIQGSKGGGEDADSCSGREASGGAEVFEMRSGEGREQQLGDEREEQGGVMVLRSGLGGRTEWLDQESSEQRMRVEPEGLERRIVVTSRREGGPGKASMVAEREEALPRG